jgi:hypothetical protein
MLLLLLMVLVLMLAVLLQLLVARHGLELWVRKSSRAAGLERAPKQKL